MFRPGLIGRRGCALGLLATMLVGAPAEARNRPHDPSSTQGSRHRSHRSRHSAAPPAEPPATQPEQGAASNADALQDSAPLAPRNSDSATATATVPASGAATAPANATTAGAATGLATAPGAGAPTGQITESGPETEPPPAPLLTDAEPPEPPPAALIPPEEPPKDILPPPTDTRGLQRGLRGVGWAGTAATLGLITAGITLGVLTQQRSDALSLSTVQLSGGLPPIYDEAQRTAYTDLQSQGQTFNTATIACFAVGGALALTSGILFWRASRLGGKGKSLALRSIGLSGGPQAGGSVILGGSF